MSQSDLTGGIVVITGSSRGIGKAADMQLARNLAHEFGPDRARVNRIAPRLIKTDLARALWEDPKRQEESNSRAPLRRIGSRTRLRARWFLARRASTFMTGQTMVIDGGVTI